LLNNLFKQKYVHLSIGHGIALATADFLDDESHSFCCDTGLVLYNTQSD